MRGRRPDPRTAVRGNLGRRKRRKLATVKPRAVQPAGRAPDELCDLGRAFWHVVKANLGAFGLLRDSDNLNLTRYVNTLAEYWRVTGDLRGRSLVYEARMTHGGTMRRLDPLFMAQDRLARRLDTMENALGMQPRARHEILYRMASQSPTDPAAAAFDNGTAALADDPVGLFGRIAEGHA